MLTRPSPSRNPSPLPIQKQHSNLPEPHYSDGHRNYSPWHSTLACSDCTSVGKRGRPPCLAQSLELWHAGSRVRATAYTAKYYSKPYDNDCCSHATSPGSEDTTNKNALPSIRQGGLREQESGIGEAMCVPHTARGTPTPRVRHAALSLAISLPAKLTGHPRLAPRRAVMQPH